MPSNAPISHLVVGYGPPKMGKTLDLGMSFCTGFFFAPALSPLTPLQGLAGFIPGKKALVTDLRKIVGWLREHRNDTSIPSVVIDDLSLIGDHTMSELTRAMGTSYERWNALNELLLELFDLTTNAPFFTCITCHEQGPGESKNTFLPGGPKLPSKNAGDNLAKNAGLILRTVVDATSAAADPAWPVVYSCDRADGSFTYGNRMGCALPQNPLNMREILQVAGLGLPRLYDWQEDMVERLSNLIVEGKLTDDLLSKADSAMSKRGADEKAVWWTYRDARARAFLKTHRVDLLSATRKGLLAAQGNL